MSCVMRWILCRLRYSSWDGMEGVCVRAFPETAPKPCLADARDLHYECEVHNYFRCVQYIHVIERDKDAYRFFSSKLIDLNRWRGLGNGLIELILSR